MFFFLVNLFIFFSFFTEGMPSTNSIPAPEFIAHAGGEVIKLRYTNSLEALNNSYDKHFTFFEIDLETTKDGVIVLLHDWDYSMENFYHADKQVYTLDEFQKLKLYNELTQLTWEDLTEWMRTHPETYIITDIKLEPVRMLKKISQLNPGLRGRIIPQIYSFPQYSQVKKLGFPNIILTLYASNYSDWRVFLFAKTHALWAVTMPSDRALKKTLPKKLKSAGIPVYAHLVDTVKLQKELQNNGVTGIYTAYLQPE